MARKTDGSTGRQTEKRMDSHTIAWSHSVCAAANSSLVVMTYRFGIASYEHIEELSKSTNWLNGPAGLSYKCPTPN